MIKLERNILFSKTSLTYPVSNSRARNLCFLFTDASCESNNIDLFVGGCNDVNYVLETVQRKSNESRICFTLNDNETYILTRLFLIMVLMLIEKDIDFIYQVRCSQFLIEEHHTKLRKYLNWIIKRMEEDGEEFSHSAFKKYKFLKGRFSYGSKECFDNLLNTFKFWCFGFKKKKEEVVNIRNTFMTNYINRLYPKSAPNKIEDVPKILFSMCLHRHTISMGEIEPVVGYFKNPVFLSRKRNIGEYTSPNPTFFSMKNGGEYSCHPSTNPFESFEEEEKMRVFTQFKKRVLKLRKNKKAHYRFVMKDIISTLRSGKRKYDFIYTSNISDNLGIINLLIASQGSLKNENSFLEVESMKMRMRKSEKNSAYDYYHTLMPFNPVYLPLLFNLVCVSDVYEKDSVTSISSLRETDNSCRLYFKPKEFYPFNESPKINNKNYQYEFDFLKLSEKDELLDQLFHFLYIILKYKGVGVSHEEFAVKSGLVALTPALTLNSFFLILKNLNLNQSNRKTIIDILLVRKNWEELMDIVYNNNAIMVIKKEIKHLLALFRMEIECLVHFHFGCDDSVDDVSPGNLELNLYRMVYSQSFMGFVTSSPILTLGFVNSKEKISIFQLDDEEKYVLFPMLNRQYEKLVKSREKCFLVIETGKENPNCFEGLNIMKFGYSIAQDLSHCFLVEKNIKNSTATSTSENVGLNEEEEVEGEEEEEKDEIFWKMNNGEILCKIFVGGNAIHEEMPIFSQKKDEIIVSFPQHKKRFCVKVVEGLLQPSKKKKGKGKGVVVFQRSKKRKLIIIRIPIFIKMKSKGSIHNEEGDYDKYNNQQASVSSSTSHLYSNEIDQFRRRIVVSNRVVFEDLPDWDLRTNEETQFKLSKIMFSMEEILRSRTESTETDVMNSDHGLRINTFYIMSHFLFSCGTARIMLQDEEQKSGFIIACCGVKKQLDESNLPVFQVVYRYDECDRMNLETVQISLNYVMKIVYGLETEVKRKYPKLVEEMNRKSNPTRSKVNSRFIANIVATREEQKYLYRFLEENRVLYEFRDPVCSYEDEDSKKLVKRSVLFPLLTSKKVGEEILGEDKRLKETMKSLIGTEKDNHRKKLLEGIFEGKDDREKKKVLEELVNGLDLSVD